MKSKNNECESEEFYRREFLKIETRKYAAMIIIPLMYILLAFIFILLEKKLGKINKPLSIVMIGIVIAPALLAHLNWRCPRCGAFFGKRFFVESCHICKIKFK